MFYGYIDSAKVIPAKPIVHQLRSNPNNPKETNVVDTPLKKLDVKPILKKIIEKIFEFTNSFQDVLYRSTVKFTKHLLLQLSKQLKLSGSVTKSSLASQSFNPNIGSVSAQQFFNTFNNHNFCFYQCNDNIQCVKLGHFNYNCFYDTLSDKK